MLPLAMQLTGYELALAIMAFLLQIALIWRIWATGLVSEHPALLRYIVATASFVVISNVAARFCSMQVYCYVYWFASLVIDGLGLAATLEIFRDIFKPYEALRQFGTVMFRWIVAVMIGVSLVSAVSTGSVRPADLINSVSIMFDRGLGILQCGIVLFLLLTNKYLGIPYRHRTFGIAVGFGFMAAVTMIVLAMTNWVPAAMVRPLSSLMSVAVCIGQGVWLTYFLMPQPDRRISDALPESRRWEYALASIQTPAPEGMFLSSIDRTVERLLTKNNVATQAKAKDDKHWFGD